MPTEKSTAPNPKEVAGLQDGGEGVVVLVKAFDGGGSLEKVKEKVETLVELLKLWWFIWRWRRKKMKVESWRSCGGGCGSGDEEELVVVGVLVKKRKNEGERRRKGIYSFFLDL